MSEFQYEGHQIPLLKNCYFALELLRTHEVAKMQQAKALLGRIFDFQTESGALPIYLDEYPHIRKPHFNFHFLPPLFYIREKYAKVVNIEESCAKLEKFLEGQEAPIPLLCLLGAYQKRLDRSLFSEWQPETSSEHAQKLIVAQMADLPMPHPEIWHSGLGRYIGPHIDEPLEKGNLLSEFMGINPKSPIIFKTFSAPERTDLPVVIQSSNQYRLQFSKTGSLITMDNLNGDSEISFYLSKELPIPCATTFKLGETLDFGHFKLTFKGEGAFLGHIAMAMRPNNTDLEKPDWKISMSPIDESKSLITATVE